MAPITPTKQERRDAEIARAAEAIVTAYRASTDAERRAGTAWYPNALKVARQLWPQEPDRAAGIIAALSPQSQWAVNIARAAKLIGWHQDHGAEPAPSIHFKGQQEKAERIAAGESPLDVLTGPKERAFYRAIVGQEDSVVVDRWAQRVAEPWDPYPDGKSVSPAHFERLSDAYRVAARYLGVAPRDVQATTWVHLRGSAD